MGPRNRPGVVTLVGIKNVTRPGKVYRYFQTTGQPPIKLTDLPDDHPDFLEAYAAAKSSKPQPTPAMADSFAALGRSALASKDFRLK